MNRIVLAAVCIAAIGTFACQGQSTREAASTPGNNPNPRGPVKIDDTRARGTYANFSRVTGTPEEMIIDFGLSLDPSGDNSTPIVIDDRIVVSYYTAKRLTQALQMSLERHEQAFGRIETEVQKRVINNP
jgi:hypothetical protein